MMDAVTRTWRSAHRRRSDARRRCRRLLPSHRHVHVAFRTTGRRVLRQVPVRITTCTARTGRGAARASRPARHRAARGLELGGVPLATMLSARTGIPALFVRKQAKQYGTCKLAEGPPVAGRRVTLVEDVITTGGAVRGATSALRDAGAVVDVVICAIDRSPPGGRPLTGAGLDVRAVLTKADLDRARERASPESSSPPPT
ncbi:MAG: phosphoribosyltransferase family protein [Ilumatobacteraceae bacterium]